MCVLAVLRAAQVSCLLGLGFLSATVLCAQERPESGLVVLVTNEKGAGVPDALVFIQQAEGGQRLEPVRTDERGRAEVSVLQVETGRSMCGGRASCCTPAFWCWYPGNDQRSASPRSKEPVPTGPLSM